jgi:hypothetical protein
MIPTLRAALLFTITVAMGCAGLTHRQVPQQPVPLDRDATATRIANRQEDEKFDGIRYYGTSMYLLVYSDGKGNIVWKLLELPDQTKKMSASYHSFFAKVEAQMTFVNGSLDRSVHAVDATVVPRALIEAAEKAVSLAMADQPRGYTVPSPQLFKIIPTCDGFQFIGTMSDIKINVTIPGAAS